MAFEADCDVSTVLEEIRVTSTAGSLVPGGCRASTQNSKLRTQNWKGWVANSKSEIRNLSNGWPKFRIPNSEFIPIRYYHSSARARLVGRGTV